ncbi:MAG: DNA-binding protein, partial [Acetatifactor sp.]|nr:DNA-binding protein [Acetatifactor sp.]
VKKELKTEISVQFDGKSYSQEDLVKIAKDVWKFDLNQKAADLTSIELYVKPEEHVAYYVMNKDFAGSFYL